MRLFHLHQDVAALENLRLGGHGAEQMGFAAPQQRLHFRARQRGFGQTVRQEREPLNGGRVDLNGTSLLADSSPPACSRGAAMAGAGGGSSPRLGRSFAAPPSMP